MSRVSFSTQFKKGKQLRLLLVILLVAIIGTITLVISHAATPVLSVTADSGTLNGPVSIITDGTASDGQAVKFGGSSDPDPSGQSVPIGSQPGWQQVFYDDFTNESVSLGQFSNCGTSPEVCTGLPSALQSKWWDYPDTWPDTANTCEYYPSQTMSVAGNIMNMFIHTASNGTCMTAVPEPLIPGASSSNGQLYGMYSVRMKSDPVAGYKTAFLLWPDSESWPQDGEIDFPEGDVDGTVGAYMHHQGATSGSQQDGYSSTTTYTSWHTYTIEWTPSYVKFLIDGQVIGDSTDTSNIPDTPMHWVLQTESDLSGVKPAASASGNLQIAWVAIWSYKPGSD
jgi:hypothetical protein